MDECTVKFLEMIGVWFSGTMTLFAVIVALLLRSGQKDAVVLIYVLIMTKMMMKIIGTYY